MIVSPSRLKIRCSRYLYAHRSSTSWYPSWAGVTHGAEIEMIFGHPLALEDQYSRAESQFSRTLIMLWTNFAKTGSVNHQSTIPLVYYLITGAWTPN